MLLSVLLCLIGIVAILAEFFIPSAGLIGIGGLGSIVAGIVLVFREYGSLTGFAFLAVNALVVPGMIFFYWKHFPRSFMGRRLILGSGVPPAAGSSPGPHTAEGEVGTALTPLRPAGNGTLRNRAALGRYRRGFSSQGEPLEGREDRRSENSSRKRGRRRP